MRLLTITLLILAAITWTVPAVAAPPIRVMLLDGESGGSYHNWFETSPYLQRMLQDAGIFQVDRVTVLPSQDFSTLKPEWSKYQVVVMNYDAPDARWPDDLRASFESYMKNGGGLVTVHAADNAFPNWKEFNLMIGVGGWRGRNVQTGPHFYFKDGKLTSDTDAGPAGSHGPRRLPFQLTARTPDHPIIKGLPAQWMHSGDELYDRLRGPGQNMTVLATAHSDPANRGTDNDEPILMALTYGKGRIFHTTMGHDLAALNCVGFMTTFQRGTEWAATGQVTQKIPADFPSADKTSTRKEYDPPAEWVSGAAPVPGAPGRGGGRGAPGGAGAPPVGRGPGQ